MEEEREKEKKKGELHRTTEAQHTGRDLEQQ